MQQSNNVFDYIADKEYLGRFLIIGRTLREQDFVAYAVTGRSSSSRARRLEEEWSTSDRVRTSCTDEEQLKKGTPELLIYNAMQMVNGMFVVSNGAQTDVIAKKLMDERRAPEYARHPVAALVDAHANPVWVKAMKDGKFTGQYIDIVNFEPDSPNWTPRISGVLTRDRAAISIVRNDNGHPQHSYTEFPLFSGRAKFISTYTGTNVPEGEVIPAFTGEPLDFRLQEFGDATKAAENIYRALRPKEGKEIVAPGKDFRVAVSVVILTRDPRPAIDAKTVNFHDKPTGEET